MCKNKDELDKLVAKRRKIIATQKKLDTKLEEINKDIIEYVLAKGTYGMGMDLKGDMKGALKNALKSIPIK